MGHCSGPEACIQVWGDSHIMVPVGTGKAIWAGRGGTPLRAQQRHRAARLATAAMWILCTGATARADSGPQLWFYDQTNLAVAANVTATENLINRASAAGVGYRYMMLSDTKLAYDGDTSINSIWDPNWGYYNNLHQVITYAAAHGITVVPSAFDLGRADNWLLPRVDENLAEGLQVKGATFTVAPDGRSLIFDPQNPAISNTSFASGSSGWSLDPGRASIDASLGHTDSDSLKISAGGGRGFGIQTFAVQPHRQYHVSYSVNEQNFGGDLLAKIYDPAAGRYRESNEGNSSLNYDTAQGGWQRKNYVFNSGNSTSVQLRLGSWGPTTGTVWFDDVSVQETALHNVVRNSSSPLTVYSGNTVFTEGADFNPIRDAYSKLTGMTYKLYRTPLTPTLPAGSRLTPGQTVQIDYDAAQPVYDEQYGASLTDPAVKQYYARNIAELRKSFAPGTGYMLGGFDELRQGASSTGEKASGLTGGQLLANHFKASYDIVRAQDPTAPIYTWSDMFDPNHNAVNNYYLWDSTVAGSWQGLPRDVTIFNWNLGNLNTSLKFFAGLGNPQIIAGYYDAADGAAAATSEVQAAAGVRGVRGLMYTTWGNNYDQLEAFAQSARAAWAADVVPHWIPGDANLDGTVDFSDLLILAQHYGLTGTAQWTDGDFTNDNNVGFDDLLLLAQHYGQSQAAAASISSVPEPACLLGGVLSGAILLFRRR